MLLMAQQLFIQKVFSVSLFEKGIDINSMRPSEANESVKLTNIASVRHLRGAKPLSEPMLPYCRLELEELISVKLYLKFKNFNLRICIWKCRLWNGANFVLIQCRPIKLCFTRGDIDWGTSNQQTEYDIYYAWRMYHIISESVIKIGAQNRLVRSQPVLWCPQ